MQLDELRKKHQKIIYKSFSYSLQENDFRIETTLHLSPNVTFNPQVTIHGVTQEMLDAIPKSDLEILAFNLGMAEIYSYWKAACPKEISIEAAKLPQENIHFWQDLLIKGMGEFFFVNKIDFTQNDFVSFATNSEKELINKQKDALHNTLIGTLLPLGGGKDSIVSLELLKQHYKEEVTLFTLNPTPSVLEIINLNPSIPVIKATRRIDPKLLELNQNGYLNGHTPFSAYLGILSLFVARLFGLKNIAISNERSSNEESVIYKNHPVNHQYSKSFELEKNLQKYTKNMALSATPYYFSFLRPLYELQIAKLFSNMTEYLPIFVSCNKGQRDGRWCCNCSKCLFAYSILYPFLKQEQMKEIFGINLLNNESLIVTAKELIGYAHNKPLDCVGTHEESLIALFLCYQKDKQGIKTLSKVSDFFEKEVLPKEQNLEARTKQLLTSWNNEHALPSPFDTILEYVHKESF